MSDTRGMSRLGEARKLYSTKGSLLGVVHYPPAWDREIFGRGGYRFAMMPITWPWPELGQPFVPVPEPNVRSVTIFPSLDDHAGVVIVGCTMEEFERIPGCAFSPGAGYLRSLVE